MPSPSVSGALLPMNCAVNASSAHFCPSPAVCVDASTTSAVITPFSSVTCTVMSAPPKPAIVAVFAFSSTMGASVAAGASVATGSRSSAAMAGEVSAALMASTAAVEVMVAPVSPSTFSFRVNGPFLPINCAVNSSSAQRVPKPGVCVEVSMTSAAIVPSSFSVRRAVTSPLPKPTALP